MKSIATSLVLAVLALAGVAAGAELDGLREKGVVGERFDGLAAVRSGDGAAQALVTQVNAKRSAIYAERAKAQGVPAVEVGKVYAQEIAAKAPSGTWFLGADGKWVQKK